MFVRVSVPARVARSASVTAVLNCAIVPDTVFEPRATVLFVKVTEFERVTAGAAHLIPRVCAESAVRI